MTGRQMTPINGAQIASASRTSAFDPNLSQDDQASDTRIRGAGSDSWFGPWQPLLPMAPDGVGGRAYDYTTGQNINYIPRNDSSITFDMLRGLADALPELRIVLEKRKDQIEGWDWDIQPRLQRKDKRGGIAPGAERRIDEVRAFLARPDRRQPFNSWLRMLLEDLLVIDAACIYPRMTRGGELYSLDVVDGATIKILIGEDGRQPLPDDGPAFQQVLHGIPAADLKLDELMYMPRNRRSNRLYGYSPVEWIIATINIALRRTAFNLNYYMEGTLPDAFATLPEDWTTQQISDYQIYFDGLMAGNLADRRKLKFAPHGFSLVGVKPPPLKDELDDWLIRIICAALSVPPLQFVKDTARATSQSIQMTTAQEGIRPLKNWIKSFMDDIIQTRLGSPDLEFTWSGDDEVDPLLKAQETQILIACGVKTKSEARIEYGLSPQPDDEPADDTPDDDATEKRFAPELRRIAGHDRLMKGSEVGERAAIPFEGAMTDAAMAGLRARVAAVLTAQATIRSRSLPAGAGQGRRL